MTAVAAQVHRLRPLRHIPTNVRDTFLCPCPGGRSPSGEALDVEFAKKKKKKNRYQHSAIFLFLVKFSMSYLSVILREIEHLIFKTGTTEDFDPSALEALKSGFADEKTSLELVSEPSENYGKQLKLMRNVACELHTPTRKVILT